MRRYQKWLTLGLVALTPGITLAGALNSQQLKDSTSANPPASAPAAKSAKGASNQEVATKIAKSLEKSKLTGYDIDVSFQNGVATLSGMVVSPEQKLAASKAAKSVSGVTQVLNRLAIAEPVAKGAVTPAAVATSRTAPRKEDVRPVNYQGGVNYQGQVEGKEPIVPIQPATQPIRSVPAQARTPIQPTPTQFQQAPALAQAPSGVPVPVAMSPTAIPAYGTPVGGGSHTMYNQPNLPNQSWPTYAQYPNYAAVTYPSQYAASAWPYIGPFYPYPQVPLGWRKAQLEWDDGYWNLNFRPRTDRWWWFLNPQNW